MKLDKIKIAAVLGLFLAVPSIIQGIRVLLGYTEPDQIVLTWLVFYNFVMGVLSLFAVYPIWKNMNFGRKSALGIVLLHSSVFIVLIVIYFTSGMVAVKSILAMSMRTAIWGFIVYLIQEKR